jgi:hypothetical protein
VQAHLIHPRPFRRGNQRDGEGQARANLLELSLEVRLVQGKTAVGGPPSNQCGPPEQRGTGAGLYRRGVDPVLASPRPATLE